MDRLIVKFFYYVFIISVAGNSIIYFINGKLSSLLVYIITLSSGFFIYGLRRKYKEGETNKLLFISSVLLTLLLVIGSIIIVIPEIRYYILDTNYNYYK